VRSALDAAANVLLTRVARDSALKRWAMAVAQRRGLKRARVALARKLSIVLHRIWVDGSEFRWTKADGTTAAVAFEARRAIRVGAASPEVPSPGRRGWQGRFCPRDAGLRP
jgi:hypothetical protein